DDGGVMARNSIANGVGNVERGGAGLNRALNHLGQEIEFRTRGVLGRKLNVVTAFASALDPLYRALDNLIGRHAQLEFAVDRAGREEDVDAWPRRVLDGI